MADYGITDAGFVRKRLEEILATKNAATIGVFGPDINLTPQSPDGQMNGLAALSDDQLWQIAEYAYNGTDPDLAGGPALSSLVKLNYITRQEDLATYTTLTTVGTPGFTIPAGQLVSVAGGSVQVRTRAAFTFGAGGTGSVVVDCTVVGPIEIEAGLLTVIDTPVAGWTSCTNPLKAITGRYRETDAELRLRRSRSTGTNSQNMLDTLRGKVGDVEGVTYLNAFDNKEDEVDPTTGLLGHSFEVIVEGGDPNEIAQAIWDSMPFGIGNRGLDTGLAIDRSGNIQTIRYTIPIQIPIYAVVSLHKYPNYPADGDATIKQAMVDYANGDLVAGRGFGPSDDVILTELYTPINTVPFHDIKGLTIGTAPAPVGTNNIPIALRETSKFTVANISIVNIP